VPGFDLCGAYAGQAMLALFSVEPLCGLLAATAFALEGFGLWMVVREIALIRKLIYGETEPWIRAWRLIRHFVAVRLLRRPTRFVEGGPVHISGRASARGSGHAELTIAFDRTRPIPDRVAFLESTVDRLEETIRTQRREVEKVSRLISKEISDAVVGVRKEIAAQQAQERDRVSQSLAFQGRGLYFLFAGLALNLVFNLVC
jgi:hypothetical protein